MLINVKTFPLCLVGCSFPFPMSMDTQILIPYQPYDLDLNGIERVIIHLSVPENYSFDTIISEYFYGRPSIMTARGAHKRHHRCYYSCHRVLIKKS